jgi:hypothetical protein
MSLLLVFGLVVGTVVHDAADLAGVVFGNSRSGKNGPAAAVSGCTRAQ